MPFARSILQKLRGICCSFSNCVAFISTESDVLRSSTVFAKDALWCPGGAIKSRISPGRSNGLGLFRLIKNSAANTIQLASIVRPHRQAGRIHTPVCAKMRKRVWARDLRGCQEIGRPGRRSAKTLLSQSARRLLQFISALVESGCTRVGGHEVL